MSRPSLLNRLALLFALLTFSVLAALGFVLYRGLEHQLILRDDAALISRVDQIRALLRDEDVLDMIHDKPQLFRNMMGNNESLLVLKFPGQAPLIEINPGKSPVPDVRAVPVDAAVQFDAIQHTADRHGTPFIAVSAQALTTDPSQQLQIIAGRLLTERTITLDAYRRRILLSACGAALLMALAGYWITRRGLRPLRRLSDQAAAIGIRNLSVRIDSAATPRELQPLIDSFNGMLDRLDISFTQLSQVSADMAHDLRTPIGNMLGQTEVALGQRRDAAYYEKLLGSNFEELQRLSKMTDNMLFLARAEHADHAIERKQLDVAAELERIVEYFEGPAEERGQRLVWHGDGQVWADPNLLRRALANLLANAVRYADADSEIVLRAVQRSDGTSMIVENSGPTIDAHHLTRLFDRFYRADASRRESSAASGLGLSIVRSIMALHQGTWLATSSECSTRFTLFFPGQASN